MAVEEDVVERINLPPDAGLVKSLGANHTFNSAIADLVDNCVDAGATNVAIRLIAINDRLDRVEVLDNGTAMTKVAITKAMTLGHRRTYVETDLGHFGIGLKAASFAHANVLTVWSYATDSDPVGRRIRRADFSQDFTCEILTRESAGIAATKREAAIGGRRGTSVIWTDIRSAYRGRDDSEAAAWLETTENQLRAHLGAIYHRLLEADGLSISILIDEDNSQESGVPREVMPIDPFGYAVSGHPAYPKRLVADVGGSTAVLHCHIWPPKADITGFRIGNRSGEQMQGFYIYRNDRLLQAGGWSDAAVPSKGRQLARVVLDDLGDSGDVATMNPEKHGLRFNSSFHDAVSLAAAGDGTTFETFLEDAENVLVESRRRKRRRAPAIAPSKGFAPRLRRAIATELPMIDGQEVNILWKRLPEGEFLDVELDSSTLWVNSRYRHLLLRERGSLNDAPVFKALLYLLTHHVFEGFYLGSKDKDQIALWNSVLGVAASVEEQMKGPSS